MLDVSISKDLTMKEKFEAEEIHKKNVEGPITAIAYTMEELMIATNNFSQDNLLGEGTSARVYKGKFSNGKVVTELQSFLSISVVIKIEHIKNQKIC